MYSQRVIFKKFSSSLDVGCELDQDLLVVTSSMYGARLIVVAQSVHYVASPLLDVLASFRVVFVALIT